MSIRFERRQISVTPSAPWTFDPNAEERCGAGRLKLTERLRPVPDDILLHLRSEGLHEAPLTALASRLGAVEELLGCVPDLATVVAATVGTIHSLAAEPGFDVSHSQPRWRDRIFISFPERLDQIGDLRLAESVVHEAMHLHLTNEEARNPLVADHERLLYSPWMDTSRSVQGVLHGVFVFRCISAFLVRLSESLVVTQEAKDYVARRIDDIYGQIAEVDSHALKSALTLHGRALVRSWAAYSPS